MYSKMITKYGINKQIIQTIEELGELTQALCKIQRHDIDLTNLQCTYTNKEMNNIKLLIGELVDVETMIGQIRYIITNLSDFNSLYEAKVIEVNNKIKSKISE